MQLGGGGIGWKVSQLGRDASGELPDAVSKPAGITVDIVNPLSLFGGLL